MTVRQPEAPLPEAEYSAKLQDLNRDIELNFDEQVQKQVEARKAAGESVVDTGVTELEILKTKETAIMEAARLIVNQQRHEDMRKLFDNLKDQFHVFPKARLAKITRLLIDMIPNLRNSMELQISICERCIQWCEDEKRTFLKHRIQTKLAGLFQQLGKYSQGLDLISKLLVEVKQTDDKLLLVEIHVVESKLAFSVKHIPKAKAALTAAKTNANAIHCPPLLQADIDIIAGSLHCEEKDFRTAYSYFYEAFEALNLQNDPKAVLALKYMMLCRIMTNASDNITNIGRGTAGLHYLQRPEVQCLVAIAKAYQQRSLENFEATVLANRKYIDEDILLSRHIDQAAEQLIEQSILKIVAPYSHVEVGHIAKKCNLPRARIESKLAEMVLDHKLSGTIDQGHGVFILYGQPPTNHLYEDSIATLTSLGDVVDLLSKRVQQIL
eukprot:Gregarina_sp_Pseudo_9__5950@NODE_962_length_2027_cov_22_169014_g902_i0_p1_GENE_NODE_962_length_2027_cov_22_169014_g902_i0NODE_962_length_2027_cov_22_169014_g902_i0_p1_ORF_typecomplete_len439_score63_14RPN6_N/PF18055_1/1_7e25RPN6_N/PF18055_1/2_8e03PCI/PF01399_27/2_3e03PCI/PF01399_27/3_6e16TPR_MalT/PF17874_1/0_00016SNAP/PF14938_6/0_12SNAP/PF14938_6/1_6e02RPN6_C_helix/PF18503_1/0_06HTH_45/PF14947_6/2_4e03HTH_45/PF14947_6/0_41_NODE_962_length_2027_cov_22_169014_g902_i01041420